jgi:hypothetical protein
MTYRRLLLQGIFAFILLAAVTWPLGIQGEPQATAFAGQSMYHPNLYQPDFATSCEHVPYDDNEVIAYPEQTDGSPLFVIPPPLEGPIEVGLGLYILDVSDIDPLDNTFTIVAFLDLLWCDPRHKLEAAEKGWGERMYLDDLAMDELDTIWWPNINFTNQTGAREAIHLELVIFPDGTVDYEEHFTLTLEGNYDLRKFPFDRQQLPIIIQPLAWPAEALQLNVEEDMVGFSEDFEVPEWHINAVTTDVSTVQGIRDSKPISQFTMEINVIRRPEFFIWKVMLPLMLLVVLSWSVFWTLEEPLPDRLTISLTGLLTVVAYQFVLRDSLPHIPYLTFMDGVLTFSFVLMAATVVENVIAHILSTHVSNEAANRVEILSRILFPLVYFVGIALMVFGFGLLNFGS